MGKIKELYLEYLSDHPEVLEQLAKEAELNEQEFWEWAKKEGKLNDNM